MASNNIRVAIAGLSLSAAAFVGILTREGYTDNAIIPTKGDVPTVGFGTTGGVKMGDRTTPLAAVQRAMRDAQTYEGAIKRCVTAPLSQEEYDLYVNFSYNIGASAFCSSTIVRRLNAGQHMEACDGILLFKYVGKTDCSDPNQRICRGLWEDRLKTHGACVAAQ
jgi:lysozyme